LLREHSEERADDVAYMKKRYTVKVYTRRAGTQWCGCSISPMARYHLTLAWKAHHHPALVAFWYMVAHLPSGLMSGLLSLKRGVTRKIR